ncbi:hypothetical protein O6H91_03G082600 [Diphasiastrum complanatum]|uniref:Uncharacterized protein n=1 Tax=Diphasiastrum complanatum TaxID=34168 RepID=A0ACC2E8A6_DIPCM|nr:hypothetical protein O6H91_03G082600 [Diphasiastrum complanatum]
MPYLVSFSMCFGKRISPKPVKDPSNKKSIRDVNQDSSNSESSESFDLTTKKSLSSSASFMCLRGLIDDGVTIFNNRELCKATENFNPSRSIGSSVFKATVRNINVVVAKKKWKVFHNIFEKLKEACSVHHTSIAKLLGACFSERDYLYLVYEYAEGFNLQVCLQKSRTTGFCVLDSWTKRLEVALDLAKGLEYLHDHTHSSFVHKFITSSNVIIGNDLRRKISMFAAVQLTGEVELALPRYVYLGEKTVRPDLLRSNSIKITGTPGYMAPEYISSGTITTKFDV